MNIARTAVLLDSSSHPRRAAGLWGPLRKRSRGCLAAVEPRQKSVWRLPDGARLPALFFADRGAQDGSERKFAVPDLQIRIVSSYLEPSCTRDGARCSKSRARRVLEPCWSPWRQTVLKDAERAISKRSERWRTHTGAAGAAARLKKQPPGSRGAHSGLWRRTTAAEPTLPPARQRPAAGSGAARRRRRGSQGPGSRRGHQRNTLRRESAREKR